MVSNRHHNHMNIRKKIPLTYLAVLLIFASCRKQAPDLAEDETSSVKNEVVNDWIYSKMKEYYLWEADLPGKEATNLTLDPEAYFESILVNPGVTDRFSWIETSSEELRNSLNGLTSTFGLKYKLYYTSSQRDRIAMAVTYTLKNSVAERMGVKRGDIIMKVNGKNITADNYTTVLQNETVTLTLGSYQNGTFTDTQNSVELTKEVTQTDALQHSSILDFGDKKIGYFVYTQFLTSNDRSLNTLFGTFKSAGINELIVDLRFNPGGYISSAELLSSLIVKDLDPSKLMTRQIWNSEQTEKMTKQYGSGVFDSYFFKDKPGFGSVNNVGDQLSRVYFLVSNSSASASELLINNLLPYMEVKLVGNHTYGKNVGSITIDDENDPKRWNWGMQPIVLKSVNALGKSDYGTKEGFTTDIEVNDNLLPFKPFGDQDETLLNAALVDILGTGTLSKARNGRKTAPSGKFSEVLKENFSDNPLLDRKDMWITEYPGR